MSYLPKIFLSGGLSSDWQSNVKSSIGDKAIFFNPREHRLEKPDYYSTWDIHFIKECDIIFAYMEATNPSGYGLAFELGMAYALNKTIILIDEKSSSDVLFERYFKITYRPSGVVINSLNEGIEYLKRFLV
ncbi:nucleoside 2-deoxyribosyltransferase [Emticicia fluvialis]|uniref:nucleoside 2-deoxyribosyltransferase n=1 Tax=Emticicia fluvialis TaxID=2974474 RepID=UPI002165B949|nr:nucleoside 2-deoxyribosyltransferase [Emticicia fluvialis]